MTSDLTAPRRRPDQPAAAGFYEGAQHTVLRTLVAAQVLSGAGLAAGATVGSLLAVDLIGSSRLAGLPSALFTAGSAAAAVGVGRLSDARGRRWGLAVGYGVGAVGAIAVVTASAIGSIVLLLPALMVYGAGTATNLQARYAGADLAAPERRASAVSTVLVATTLGAVVGPTVVSPMGRLADGVGLPRLSGPFLLAATAYALAALVLLLRLRPDPLLLARQRAALELDTDMAAAMTSGGDDGGRSLSETARAELRVGRGVILGGLTMVSAQLVMVAIMTMTPLHMAHHGHGLSATGVVIAAHIAGMYLPSPLTGRLVDRLGANRVAIASGLTLVVAGVVSALAPADRFVGLTIGLVVLGIGWNLGLVAGTSLVTERVPLAVRARVQGAIDLCVAVAGAGGGIGSGVVVAGWSYRVLAFGGAAIALVVVAVVGIEAGRRPVRVPAPR